MIKGEKGGVTGEDNEEETLHGRLNSGNWTNK